MVRTNYCFGKVVGAKRCFQVLSTVIDVRLEMSYNNSRLFVVHHLSSLIEMLSTMLHAAD